MMWPRRPPDDDDDEAMRILPIDDAAVFDIRERQKRLHESGAAHTRRKMAECWRQIEASLQAERNRMKWIDTRTGRRIE